MSLRLKWELFVVAVLILGSSFLAIRSAIATRAEVRDDLRRDDISNLKRGVEIYYNQFNTYPLPPVGSPICAKSDDSHSWIFGESSPLLKSQSIDAIPHDVRETEGHVYQYCATQIRNEEVTGYYLQAWLEVEQAAITGFDEDEKRKFHYRTLFENKNMLYRVCGGTEKQCSS